LIHFCTCVITAAVTLPSDKVPPTQSPNPEALIVDDPPPSDLPIKVCMVFNFIELFNMMLLPTLHLLGMEIPWLYMGSSKSGHAAVSV
jgi:hypothetical protein